MAEGANQIGRRIKNVRKATRCYTVDETLFTKSSWCSFFLFNFIGLPDLTVFFILLCTFLVHILMFRVHLLFHQHFLFQVLHFFILPAFIVL